MQITGFMLEEHIDFYSQFVAVQKFYKECSRTILMVFTEIKVRNNNKYYYRVLSFRDKNKISKKRIYIGKNLTKNELKKKEIESNKEIYAIKRKRKNNEFEKIKKKIIPILKEKGIKKAGIFGSYARGEQKKNSDIDILIDPTKEILGFEFVGFQEEISKKLRKKVELVTYNSLHHLIKERVLNQEVRII